MSKNRHNNAVDFCDLLAAYELNLLESDERLGFETHLTECSACLEEIYAMAPSMNQLTADPGVFAEQARLHLDPETSESLVSRISRMLFTGPARVLVPVAMAAVLAMLIFLPQTTETKFRTLAMTDAPAFSPIQVRSGQQEPWLALWDQGMESYQSGEYRAAAQDLVQAIAILDSSANPDVEKTELLAHARLFLGVSQMLSEQTAESLITLQRASESRLIPIHQKGMWYLAQAHLLNEQPRDALRLLKQLENSPVYGPQAAELIIGIEEIIND